MDGTEVVRFQVHDLFRLYEIDQKDCEDTEFVSFYQTLEDLPAISESTNLKVNLCHQLTEEPVSFIERRSRRRSYPSRAKAKKILKDGRARGKKFTPKQRSYFGWAAGGHKPRKTK